jgi:pimeloyl-ACP methyl ester carboxylesterase
MEIKKLITYPLQYMLSGLNYLQDIISKQPRVQLYNDIKISLEHKEECMSFEDLVMTKGYPLEIHYVVTTDGYILKLYRIPGGKNEKNWHFKQKQAIFIMHGIFDSSDGLICNDEDKCIPYILANMGYDVWLGNNRGNKHSRFHTTLSPDSNEFWDFSFHEMGLYDLPASINHVLKTNKYSDKIIYIGHSQGTAQLFAALTQQFEYFKKTIKLFVAMGPVARVYFLNSRMLRMMVRLKLDIICNKLNFKEMLSCDEKLSKATSWLLPKTPLMANMASELVCDHNSKACNNQKRISVYLSHMPGGSSLKAVSHFVQLYRSKTFQFWDYGKKKNLEIYNSPTPKHYDLSIIKDFPIALFSGKLDRLSTPVDVKWLIEQLGDNIVYHKCYDNMAHMTFMMAEDMSWFNDVIELIDLYN